MSREMPADQFGHRKHHVAEVVVLAFAAVDPGAHPQCRQVEIAWPPTGPKGQKVSKPLARHHCANSGLRVRMSTAVTSFAQV